MTSTYDPDVAEALLPLAFSLHANPGAYAVVAGAGMSYGAVPVAWQVFTDLISRAASQYGETVDGDAAESWYLQKFGSGASYESVLEKLGPTPTVRFTPDGGHRDSGTEGSAGRMSSCPALAGLLRPSTKSRPPTG